MTLNIRSCPFCGGEAQELALGHQGVQLRAAEFCMETPVSINCKDCGALGPIVFVDTAATPGAMLLVAAEEWGKREPCKSCGEPPDSWK